jgi:TonB family protein
MQRILLCALLCEFLVGTVACTVSLGRTDTAGVHSKSPASPHGIVIAQAPDPNDYYPAEARQKREQGRTIVHFCVDTSGRVSDVAVKQSTGFPLLDSASTEMVKGMRFLPATDANGDAVIECLDMPVTFAVP